MSAYGGHPDRKEIRAYVTKRVGAADRLWISEHLQLCTSCYRTFAAEALPGEGQVNFAVSAVPEVVRVPERPRSGGIHAKQRGGRQGTRPQQQSTSKSASAGVARTGPAHVKVPPIVNKLLSRSVDLLPSAQQERYYEEWKADLFEVHGKWHKVWWALWLRFYSAHVLRRIYRRQED